MELTIGTEVHGFTVESVQNIMEIDGVAYTMRHASSGARLLYLKNDDENKAFSIAFKTPPVDSTGVFHILEHSVLCGSERFPVKEPFVNLIKSSMQTFLNAMTFPDKTMYPVASTNEQDLLNLMDVYMDAVLNPAIYNKRAIFEQEGWHYEIDDTTAPLRYNGVVYNEMKGALSDPDSVLYNTLSGALFPDTTYAFESGGDPETIPELTYENFLDSHARHYQLSNSYIVLYGDMQVERELAFLNDRYLSQPQKSVGAPNALELQKPIKNLNAKKIMQTAPENACMGLGYVIGPATDRQRIVASDVLIDVLMGSNEAPLKRALIAAGIADDAQGYLAESQLQPALMIQLKGSLPNTADRFLDVVNESIATICAEGIDPARIEASLARSEFILRERNFGTADGVVLAMSCMAGWLYDDDMPTDYLCFEDTFAFMRASIGTGYFENLLREIMLENNHMARAVVEPVEKAEDGEVSRLATIKETMDNAALSQIIAQEAELRRLQEEPDSAQDLATLPLLTLGDIASAPVDPPCAIAEGTALPCLYHTVPTRHIDYIYLYFDMSRLAFEDIPYVTLLAMLLGKLDTNKHTADELDTLTQTNLGNLNFFPEVFESEKNPQDILPHFVVATSVLSENIEHAVSLPHEIWSATTFADHTKIRDILTQRRIAIEQNFAAAGHSAALQRVSSYTSKASVLRESLGGIDFYRFLKTLLADFDGLIEGAIGGLEHVRDTLFTRENIIVSFTGEIEDRGRFWDLAGDFGLAGQKATSVLQIPEPTVKNEAFVVPSDVCYTAKGYNRRLEDIAYGGAWHVAAKALSYDYLWNEVRVKGGAYGAGFRSLRSGAMQFYSYRDPNLDATLTRFDESASWLSAFDPDEAAMRGYIISSVAGMDAPSKPRELSRRQDADYFSGREANYREAQRTQVLETTPEALRKLGPKLARITAHDVRCAFGNREIIEDSQLSFEVIDLLS